MKCKRDSDARSHDHHALQVMRQQAVKAVRNGETTTSVAAAMGVNIRTVFRWLADFAEGGQNALLAKPIPGRPPILDADQLQWIAKTVKDHTPQQMRFEFALWTLSLVGEVIYQKFGKRLSAGSLSRVMRILGYTPQKPKYLAWQQDPILVETWRTEIFPAVKAEAKETGAVIYFADEAGIRSDYRSGTTWAPQGETPTVKVTGPPVWPEYDFCHQFQGRFSLHDSGGHGHRSSLQGFPQTADGRGQATHYFGGGRTSNS